MRKGSPSRSVTVTEPSGALRPAEKELIERFKKAKLPVVLAINKVDTIPEKEQLMARILEFSKLYPFTAVVPISAIDGTNLPALEAELEKLAPAEAD